MTEITNLDMEFPKIENLGNICRVCLQIAHDLTSIFVEQETSVAEMISECTKYKVRRCDNMPHLICGACARAASAAFEFKRLCEDSYNTLMEWLATEIDNAKYNLEKSTQTESAFFNTKNKCFICQRRFQLREHLTRHLALMHKIVHSIDELVADELSVHQSDEEEQPLLIINNADSENEPDPLVKVMLDDVNKSEFRQDEMDIEQKLSVKKSAERTQHQRKRHKCDECDKCYKTEQILQRHKTLHGQKRYICRECSQSYDSKDDLGAHTKAAGHDKPLLCPECGLRCKTSNILMIHLRRHKGEKPFKCRFCSKGFPRIDDLRVHEKYHTGEKSHFCDTCGKGFQRKYNLTIHLRVHTGEKPYKCPHCPQAFTQNNDLKAHIRRHTGERFRCEICNAAFVRGYQIRQHKLSEHGIKDQPPIQRLAKFTSLEEQEQQIKQNLKKEFT